MLGTFTYFLKVTAEGGEEYWANESPYIFET